MINKKYLTAMFCMLCFVCLTHAQTIFTYGTHAVTKDEFLQAYNKNPDTTGNKVEKMRQYLDLYVNFRLKLQAAYDEKANANEDIKAEAENFRSQLAENFINDQADIHQLTHEAFLRNKMDILLQQVFVQVPSTGDTTAAYAQISKAYSELKSGKNFDEVTGTYSSDPAVKDSKGMIGYITVFTLPYAIENLVYSLKPGNFSAIYRSKAGYHIFKNAGERPALGRRKIQQLLFPTLPFFNDEQKAVAGKEADSVYKLLQAGGNFATLIPIYGHNSDDGEGNTIEIKVGAYNSDFENAVFSLAKPGDITKPFKTEYGYNIVKLVELLPPVTDENDVQSAAYLQEEVKKDGRLDIAKNNLVSKWLVVTHFKEATYNHADLWMYTDSALKSEEKLPALYKGIKPTTILFEFAEKKVPVSEWVDYIKFIQVNSATQKNYEAYMQDFIHASCTNYYREHIEDFDPPVKEQLKEFNDANMLFFVMDKHVWGKASDDTAGLQKFYMQHANEYKWNKSVTALVISGPDKAVISEIAVKIKNDPAAWHQIIEPYGNSIYADSSRFEADQLPIRQPLSMEKGFQTQPEANDAGDAFTFVHVLEVYPQPAQRSFDEARGLVINDYQQQLEQEWLAQLKKTYPVKINEAVLKSIQ